MDIEKYEKKTWSKETTYALGLFKYLTKCLGSWPPDCHKFTSLFIFFTVLLIQIAMMFTLVIEVCFAYEDNNDKANTMCFITSATLSITKILFIRLKSKNMFKIVNNAVDDWQSVTNYENKKIMKKFAKKARKILIYQLGFSFITINMMILDSLPVSQDNSNLTADSQLLNSFPMKTTYYFGYIELSWYKYTALYFLQIIQLIFCAMGNVGNDCYFFGMAMHLCSQFVILRLQTKDFKTEINKNNNCTNYIKNFVKKHQQLIDIANCLKESFNFILVVQLANNAFAILLMGIQMLLNIRSGDNVTTINAIVIILIVSLQLFLYCHAGEELKYHSESLRTALFKSPWYNMPNHNVKNILFIMLRASKAFNLTAGSVYNIDIDTFTKIVKGMGSYFSVLQALFIE
ncbi:odorant receptor 4-like [Aphidius gifuensis]|uniref:Odorant receptor n=1 Tax=Aphidius gifuensis TaxID=684658 RepID=A0A3S9LWB0_APHGI|nr:odorant receptor 4-like [Aphidius gifuensis]AZQ24918.1 odorant receptor [Aphidius gifuensis]